MSGSDEKNPNSDGGSPGYRDVELRRHADKVVGAGYKPPEPTDMHQQTWLAARETLAIQLMSLSYATYRDHMPDWRQVQPLVKQMWRGEAEKIMRGEQ